MSTILSPTTLAEALELLQRGEEMQPLAGGTDLLVHLRRTEQAAAPTLLSLERIPELRGIDLGDGYVSIGAATRFSEIGASPLLLEQASILAAAARTVGGPAIRNMATLGGNLCIASPAGDSLPPLYALGAEIELASLRGRRRLPLPEFVLAPGRTCLARDELLTRILLPRRPGFSRQGFEKIGHRQSLAIAVVSFAGLLRFDAEERVVASHFAWGAVGPTIVTLPALESLLRGEKLSPSLVRQAVALVRNSVQPISDLRAGAEYRRMLAGNLLQRFLLQCPAPAVHD
ncbi:xanthine dehydrogenase family protein subunit M [Thauera aromatica]|uniref:FAD binding domain-containing protein n=1 Tax=Thauera aromatica TaxID=59405 RepID=UPI001FFDCA0C|nr:xanthine dehydrogenase family protein subunit M [Thauera aromatica]MCK2088839.1 xanthine dehydrogenase family protein subunit M [Thauera aromatica]